MTARRAPVIGVMGGGDAAPATLAMAHALGARIAKAGWILLNGGRAAGVMAASAEGASEAGGFVVGILPSRDGANDAPSTALDLAIFTGMGDAHNAINVLSSDVVIAMRGGAGTLSEIALAVKARKPIVLLGFDAGHVLPGLVGTGRVAYADDVDAAIAAATLALRERS